jgi:hypothetical protein
VLTPEGHAAMREVEQARRRNIEALVCDWDNAGQCDLGAVLARLNQALVRNEAKHARPRLAAPRVEADHRHADGHLDPSRSQRHTS